MFKHQQWDDLGWALEAMITMLVAHSWKLILITCSSSMDWLGKSTGNHGLSNPLSSICVWLGFYSNYLQKISSVNIQEWERTTWWFRWVQSSNAFPFNLSRALRCTTESCLETSLTSSSININMEHLPATPIVLLKSISEVPAVPACEVLVLVCFFCELFFYFHSCIQKAPVLHVGPWQFLCEAPAAMLGSSALCGAVYSLAFTAIQARRGWDLFEVRLILIQNAPKPTIWDGF